MHTPTRSCLNRTAIILALTVSAIGCDNQPASPATRVGAESIDPCTLVTHAEAVSVLKAPSVAEGVRQNSGTFDQCQFLGGGPKIQDMVSLTVQLHRVDFESMKKAYEQSGEAITAVPGLNDAAFWDARNNFLFAKRDTMTIGIQIGKNAPDNRDAAIHLMRLALTRPR